MCGRVIQSSPPIRYGLLDGMDVRDSRVHNHPPRWNAGPSQELLVIRRNHDTGKVSLDPLRWGLIPYWCKDPKGGRKPINAKYETVRDLPTFRDAYHKLRCIVPVDGFFEWKAIKGSKAKMENSDKKNPLQDELASKMLPEKETSEPVGGLLYFPMEKQKVKDLELIYTTSAGKLSIRFK